MPEYKDNAATTNTNVRAVFVGGGAVGAGDSAAFVGIFDIGQGGFNAVFNADGRPFLYYDMGGGIKGLLYSYPEPPPQFCFSTLHMIVQSHFDEDHYKTATLPAFRANLNGNHAMVVPRQDMGLFVGAAKANLLANGVHIYYWPNAGLARILLGATGIDIVKCGGGGKNHNGLAVRIEDPGAPNEWVLLPGDAHFATGTFPWNANGNPDGQMLGISPTHHGARELQGNIPRGMGGGADRVTAYSFGAGNLYGHPFNQAAHAAGDGVGAYQARVYTDAGRMQTAGRPLDKPNAGPRGSNLGILLSGGQAARLGLDPNVAPGNAAVVTAGIALVAAASAAAHQAAHGNAYASRIPVAAAYQAAMEYHRLRADRPVADYIGARDPLGGAAAPIVTDALALGAMQAWLAASLNGHDSSDAVDAARTAEPLARAIAQLVGQAAQEAARRATTIGINTRAMYAGAKTQMQEARRAVRATVANGSVPRVQGAQAARHAFVRPAPGIRCAQPQGLVYVAATGRLLVADTGDATIVELDYGTGAAARLAGAPGRAAHADGIGIAARFSAPRGLAFDGAGGLFIADSGNHVIRMLNLATNTVTTIAGAVGVAAHADGNGAAINFDQPYGLAYDAAAAILYVADSGNAVLRAVRAGPSSATIIGTAGVAGGDDGAGLAARLSRPAGVALSPTGVLYLADAGNHTVRKVVPAGGVATLGGHDQVQATVDAAGAAARFHTPAAVAADGAGNYFIADSGAHCIRRISAAGVVTTVAGQAGASGHADGAGLAARFNGPQGLAYQATANVLWVADTLNHAIRRIDIAAGFMVTTPLGGAGVAGHADGVGILAGFSAPCGVIADATSMIVADTGNHTLRHVDLTSHQVTTALGAAGAAGLVDGNGGAARLNAPRSLALDGNGSLWIADSGNAQLRVMDQGWNLASRPHLAIGSAVGVVARGNTLCVLDSTRHAVHIASNANPIVVLGTIGQAVQAGSTDGRYADARWRTPLGAAFDVHTGNLVVADSAAATVRMLTLNRAWATTVAGSAGQAGHQDATGANARFREPSAVQVLANGDLLVADSGNHVLRNISAAGVVTTVAGVAGTAGDTDGAALGGALLQAPAALACDLNDVYVADRRSHMIRRLAGGNVTTMPDVELSTVLSAYLLSRGNGGALLAYPNGGAVITGADALCAVAAMAYCHTMAASFGGPASDPAGVLVPARQPPEAAALAHAELANAVATVGALAALANMEAGVLAAMAATAALGPAVETQTTGVAVPGVAHDAADFQRRLVAAAVAALVGMRQAGAGADNARAAVAAARAAVAAARGAPLVSCHRHPSQCGAALCSLMIHEFG